MRWSSVANSPTMREREQFRQICKMLAAVYHYEYFDRLEKLRHAYFYFNPELDPRRRDSAPMRLDRAYAELVESLHRRAQGRQFRRGVRTRRSSARTARAPR